MEMHILVRTVFILTRGSPSVKKCKFPRNKIPMQKRRWWWLLNKSWSTIDEVSRENDNFWANKRPCNLWNVSISDEYVSLSLQKRTVKLFVERNINELVQERRNSSVLAMELRLFCTDPSILPHFDSIRNITLSIISETIKLVPVRLYWSLTRF